MFTRSCLSEATERPAGGLSGLPFLCALEKYLLSIWQAAAKHVI